MIDLLLNSKNSISTVQNLSDPELRRVGISCNVHNKKDFVTVFVFAVECMKLDEPDKIQNKIKELKNKEMKFSEPPSGVLRFEDCEIFEKISDRMYRKTVKRTYQLEDWSSKTDTKEETFDVMQFIDNEIKYEKIQI